MKKLLLVLSLAVCTSTVAFAQIPAQQGGGMQGGGMQSGGMPDSGTQGGMHGQFMQACGADMQNFCASAQSRDDRRSCMMANKDKFSDSCKSFMASHPMHQHSQGGQ